MTERPESEIQRRNIARYRYLLENLRDQRMRVYLQKLIEEAEGRLVEIEHSG